MNDYRDLAKYKKGMYKPEQELLAEFAKSGKTKVYRVLSFGGGTQSSHLLEEHLKGNIQYDYIIFADTGAEPQFIHDQVEWWRKRMITKGCKTPFIITQHNSMQRGLEEMLFRYMLTNYNRFQMPLFFKIPQDDGTLKNGGMMPRQCTGDFKIIPVQQESRRRIKTELGLKHTQQIPKNVGILMDIGFSYDEVNRIGGWVSHQSKYIYLNYPLVEMGQTTKDSIELLTKSGFPDRRSRCYFCPFNCDKAKKDIGMDWDEIIEHEPLSFLKACYFDTQLRKVQSTGAKNMQAVPFFHYARVPLKEVYAEEYKEALQQCASELKWWIAEWHAHIEKKYVANGEWYWI